MNRRKFIQNSSFAALLLAGGKTTIIKRQDLLEKKLRLRFAVASDGHYGQPNTDYKSFFETLVLRINQEHSEKPFAFCMINGDIIHDDKKFTPDAKYALDKLHMKYYVSQGNHDKLTSAEWEAQWLMPTNLSFTIKKNGFIIASTSNETGKYLCPDLRFMAGSLEKLKHKKNVFIFIHINPVKLTTHAVDCPDLLDLLKKYPNVRAVFNGHDHDEENIKSKDHIPFVFDAHFGGNWGTDYRGFRIVELYSDNSIGTWVMNPIDKINEINL